MSSATIWHDVYLPSAVSAPDETAERIHGLRLILEKRIYSDLELLRLPEVPESHPHFREWQNKKKSSEKLIRHLEAKNELLHILVIGSGNGWLSYQLSRIPGSRVIGIDNRLTELQQAARVFNSNSKLKFIYGDIRGGLLSDLRFDAVILSASIENFPCLAEIIDAAIALLYTGAELHILHSRLFRSTKVEKAIRESDQYYRSIGLPEMSRFYYHHTLEKLNEYRFHVYHNPSSLFHFFRKYKDPYWWLCFKKE